jgi:hypothetical protein
MAQNIWRPSNGPTFDLNPTDPRGNNEDLGRCDLVTYFDNGAIRKADGSLVTHELWGGGA